MGSEDHLQVAVRAIIYLRSWARGPELHAHCQAMGYRTSVIYDPGGTKFNEVYEGVIRGQAEVIVTWSMADLPPDRVPRIEAVESAPLDIPCPRPRRPKFVRRPRKTDPRPD